MGGDEFAFCLFVSNEHVAKMKCQEIHESVSTALTKQQSETTCSLGASAQNTLGAAFCVADDALYAAKSAGKGTWRFQV
jgi:GGDEF domain-containing protein